MATGDSVMDENQESGAGGGVHKTRGQREKHLTPQRLGSRKDRVAVQAVMGTMAQGLLKEPGSKASDSCLSELGY